MTSMQPMTYVTPVQRTIPLIAPRKISDMPPEVQEGIKARRAEHEARYAESQRRLAEAEAHRIAAAKNEVWYRGAPNVSTLTREQALYQIEYMSELIQSGEADKVPLSTAKGQQTTSNYRQYVYWLQQHVKELESAGQSTLAQA